MEGLTTGRQNKAHKGDDQGASRTGKTGEGDGLIVDEDRALDTKERNNLL